MNASKLGLQIFLSFTFFILSVIVYSSPSDIVSQPPEQQFQLAMKYYRNHDYQNAAPHLKELALAGIAGAQYLYGIMLIKGEGVSEDVQAARNWLLKSASQGNSYAQYSFACMLLNGEGGVVDREKAFAWMKKSSEQNNVLGIHWLGEMYINGWGTEKDIQKGINLLRSAGAQGDSSAFVRLANIYLEGALLAQDKNLAQQFFLQAAEIGSLEAKYRLALYFQDRTFGYASQKKIIALLIESAIGGYTPAQIALGYMYSFDKRETVNSKEAMRWFLTAANNGDINGLKPLIFLASFNLLFNWFSAGIDADPVLDNMKFQYYLEKSYRERHGN